MRARLAQRWAALVRGSLAKGGGLPRVAEETGEMLARRYGEEARAYHSLRHVEQLLGLLDEVDAPPGRLSSSPRARAQVELAIWFHDVVYDMGPEVPHGRNEELSAQAFARFCQQAREAAAGEEFETWWTTPAEQAKVEAWIRATANHTAAEHATRLDADGLLFLDLDLAILGAAPDENDEYARNVRLEWKHLSDDAFRAGRSKVLRTFLAAGPESLYRRPELRARLGAATVANLTRELQSLL